MKDVRENNILIADFMPNIRRVSETKGDTIGHYEMNVGLVVPIPVREDQLKYHCSYDWLMPVIEEIQKHSSVLCHFTHECRMHSFIILDGFKQILSKDAPSMIEAYYTGCIEFIKWYNANEKQKHEQANNNQAH